MEQKNYFENYIEPKIDVIEFTGHKIICSSGEAPSMEEGWKKDWDEL